MTERERMLAGRLYFSGGEELRGMRSRAKELNARYNSTMESQQEERLAILKELFGNVGSNPWIEPNLRCDYGKHISIGNNFYANYDCIFLDCAAVTIGDNVLFGPRVCVFTAGHPIDPVVRASGLEQAKSITIGSNVWVGGNTVINPGVTIGDNVVIGSGSVVTKDIPSDVIAVGNPCRILRKITEEDRIYWQTLEKEYRAEISAD